MKLKIHSIHFDADQKLVDFVQEKVDKLDHFFDKIIDGEVFLRLDKASNNENKIAAHLFQPHAGRNFRNPAVLYRRSRPR